MYSEGDFLPGLIVDRYGDVLSVQILTAGMETVREILLDALERVYSPRLVYERSEGGGRRLEGLEERKGPVRGGGPATEEIETDGVRFLVDVSAGPKTGFFLDQRANRNILRRLAEGKDVLDGFCAAGGFGLYALAGGAKSVLAVDSSRQAVETARANADRKRLLVPLGGGERGPFPVASGHGGIGRRFDLVVLDPPSFTKSREGREGAIRGYRDINRTGLSVLSPGGLLATSSCTQLVDVAKWKQALADAAADAGADLELVAWGGSRRTIRSCCRSRNGVPEVRGLQEKIIMTLRSRMTVLALLMLAACAPAWASPPPAAVPAAPPRPEPAVMVATIAAPITPVTADYLASAIERAEEGKASLLVVELDTPGGLDSAMRQMVQAILSSKVPVAVFVSPSGARAASAGVLITLAADIAAMAPGTNIGAAHPVNVGGGRWTTPCRKRSKTTPRPTPGRSRRGRGATPTGPKAPSGRARPSPRRTRSKRR
jgi:SAM-dependent methyltransferase/lipoprotein-anchoring transpeptidase ErfK/SrfK